MDDIIHLPEIWREIMLAKEYIDDLNREVDFANSLQLPPPLCQENKAYQRDKPNSP